MTFNREFSARRKNNMITRLTIEEQRFLPQEDEHLNNGKFPYVRMLFSEHRVGAHDTRQICPPRRIMRLYARHRGFVTVHTTDFPK
jgi:hypothetical protein